MELEILEATADFCEKNGLKYLLAYGTLLGAIRHKGFIPWDDDIDIMMPRQDYEKLLQLWQDDDRYQVLECRKNRDYPYQFAKVCMADTYMVEKDVTVSYDMGLYIDIFPCDEVPSDPRKTGAMVKHLARLEKMRMYSMSPQEKLLRGDSRWNLDRKLLFWILKGVGPHKLSLKIDRIARRFQNGGNVYGGFLSTRYPRREVQPLTNFGETVMLEFEGKQFRAPAAYDAVLRLLYGDYMEFPPEEERVLKHGFSLWKCK